MHYSAAKMLQVYANGSFGPLHVHILDFRMLELIAQTLLALLVASDLLLRFVELVLDVQYLIVQLVHFVFGKAEFLNY
jgi:hypothetical protein